jgi:phosphate transport system substrate-binding protein
MRIIVRQALSLVISVCLLWPLAACGSQSNPQGEGTLNGTITISGAFALYPMMQKWAEEFTKINPGVTFDISAGGAGKGMTDALSGAVDIGMISREISVDEEGKGAFWVPVAKDAVFVVVNEKNPALQDLMAKGVPQKTFVGIYITGDIKTWGEVVGRPEIKDEIHVYTRSDSSGAGDTWAKYLGKKAENLKGIGVMGDPGLLEAVVKDPQGIGFNNLNYAFDPTSGTMVAGTAVLPIDRNDNGTADPEEIIQTKARAVEMVLGGKYPSPPARLLYLATKGQPTGLVQTFIQWILSDGQAYTSETGFISLTSDQVSQALNKI